MSEQSLTRNVLDARDLRCPGLTVPVMAHLKAQTNVDCVVIVLSTSETREARRKLDLQCQHYEWVIGEAASFTTKEDALVVYLSRKAKELHQAGVAK